MILTGHAWNIALTLLESNSSEVWLWVLQGDGVPPSEAREFCDWLAGPAAPNLPDLYYSVCALGDT